jgi:uncharacterized protein YbjT (DUF2867 family)
MKLAAWSAGNPDNPRLTRGLGLKPTRGLGPTREGAVRVLLTGATGLIGQAVLAALHGEGHAVVAVARNASAATRLPEAASGVALDIAKATRPTDWLAHLAGIDAVVNCAGVLQDSPRDSTAGVHADGATALFAACEQAGVRRVVQISAIGIDRGAATAFARSKLAGDEALMTHNLEWVILRPSVVVGRQAYGGSALFRGLAALPVMPRIAGTGPLQVVQLDDVVRTVLFFIQPDVPTRLVLEIAGPERLSLQEVLIAYRRWLGFGEARFATVPGWLVGAACRLGDLIGLLGWRPSLRSTTRRELMRGAVGNPAPWMRLTGIEPCALSAALAAEPTSVQERWFAQLFFAKPLTLGVLSVYWLATGLVALGPGSEDAVGLIQEAGLSIAAPLAAAGAIADIAIGIGIAIRRTARPALWAALALSVAYVAVATLLLPGLWADPLGPLVKVLPIMILNLVALAVLDDR